MKYGFRSPTPSGKVFRRLIWLIALILIFIFQTEGFGQKRCNNPPSLLLSSTSGSTCYLTPITIDQNQFGGSATMVTMTENGSGSLLSSSASSSPFTITYVPDIKDIGKTVTINITTNNPSGSPCKAAKATFQISVIANPSAPVIDSVSNPSCTRSTGIVYLRGLPAGTAWTIVVSPGGLTQDGTGTNASVSNLSPGSYSFTVSTAGQCISQPSAAAVIADQPLTPSPPVPGQITAPTCDTLTGRVLFTSLPSSGQWTLTRYPGTVRTSGTGTTANISNIPSGTYNYTVSNMDGCISALSPDVSIPAAPPLPSPPVIDTVIQPTVDMPTGFVTLSHLPMDDTWTLINLTDHSTVAGSGEIFTVTQLVPGTYSFAVKSSSGCSSYPSGTITITQPAQPELVITDPAPVCFPARVDLTAPEITAGSTNGLRFSYWKDQQATTKVEDPQKVPDGTYYIEGTSGSGYSDIKPVIVKILQLPSANAGPDQTLAYQYGTELEAVLQPGETGQWRADSDKATFSNESDPHASVSNLTAGKNVLSWIVTNNVCPADTDKILITVGELLIPTLITPNGDSRNDRFVIVGIEALGNTEMTIFDRRGTIQFRQSNYDNTWDGVDSNNKPLPDDTYFYLLQASEGRTYRGYIVVRR